MSTAGASTVLVGAVFVDVVEAAYSGPVESDMSTRGVSSNNLSASADKFNFSLIL